MTKMNKIEEDFIEFICRKRNRPYKEVKRIYLSTKNRFQFSSSNYRKLTDTIHNLFKIYYGDKNETELIDSYKFNALMHLFRFISYSYPPKKVKDNMDYLGSLKKGIFGALLSFKKRKILGEDTTTITNGFSSIAKLLVEKINKAPIVVDYGAGLGYISFEIGMLNESSCIHLIDIDCLILEFAEFRFKKHDIKVEIVKVSKDNIYPKLPKHNICIATEVMEHVMQPLKVYKNIKDSLEVGGIIYGNFEDHKEEMFHVSPNLSEIRCRLNEDFERIGDMVYRKN